MPHQVAQGLNSIKLRTATLADSSMLLDWRNDPETQKNSHTSGVIIESEHDTWFAKALVNPTRQILIGMENGISVGMIRLDFRSDQRDYLLSWAVAPSSRGRGIGSKMLLEVCKRFSGHKLTAEIKRDNQASLSMVLKCGFILSRKENDFEMI